MATRNWMVTATVRNSGNESSDSSWNNREVVIFDGSETSTDWSMDEVFTFVSQAMNMFERNNETVVNINFNSIIATFDSMQFAMEQMARG